METERARRIVPISHGDSGEVYRTKLIYVVPMFTGCRLAQRLLPCGPPSELCTKTLRRWREDLGADLGLAGSRLDQMRTYRPLGPKVGKFATWAVHDVIRFANATRHLKAMNHAPGP
jgi:hypothetical protein